MSLFGREKPFNKSLLNKINIKKKEQFLQRSNLVIRTVTGNQSIVLSSGKQVLHTFCVLVDKSPSITQCVLQQFRPMGSLGGDMAG